MEYSFNFGKEETIDERKRVRLPEGYLAVFRERMYRYALPPCPAHLSGES